MGWEEQLAALRRQLDSKYKYTKFMYIQYTILIMQYNKCTDYSEAVHVLCTHHTLNDSIPILFPPMRE